MKTAAASTRMRSATTPIVRNGIRGAAVNRSLIADMEYHLSGTIQPGRCDVAAVRARRSSV